MTSDELNALRRWAEVAAPVVGVSQVRQVLALLDDHARLTALVQSLAERCTRQSEMLSQHAEKQSS